MDGDGDLDFSVANQWTASQFYRNESTGTGALLGLHLMLPLSLINRRRCKSSRAILKLTPKGGTQLAPPQTSGLKTAGALWGKWTEGMVTPVPAAR